MPPAETPPLAIHLNVSFTDRRVIAPSRALRRALARLLGRLSTEFPILAFSLADTHLHVLVLGDAAVALRLGGRIKNALQQLHGRPGAFNPTHCEPVLSQRHLANAFHYVLDQDAHHDARVDPLHDGSNLPDLLGLRRVATATRTTVRAHLPRVSRADLLAHYGVDDIVDARCGDTDSLADVAAAALALPDLEGRSALAVQARVAAVHATSAPTRELAVALGRDPSVIRRLRRSDPDEVLVRAVSLQLDLRRRLASRLDPEARFDPPPDLTIAAHLPLTGV